MTSISKKSVRATLAGLAGPVHRLGLRLAYPALCRLERLLGVRSDVALVAVWHGGKLLVVRHSYRPGEALPGGTIGPGEAPAEAARRELYEEVGIAARLEEMVFVRCWTERRGRRWLYAYHPAELPLIRPDQREVVAARFIAANEASDRVKMALESRPGP